MNKIAAPLVPALLVVLAFARAAFAAEPPPTDVVVLNRAKVDDAFAKGIPMLVNSSYKIQAGRRITAPGQVEVHARDTDIFYIVDGTATIVTGGKTEGGNTTGEGEIRGEKITGGTKRQLQKGDVMVIPSGVPHWFTEVSNPFLYFVVKVTK
jgi:mannose-6-phosphate isomerase-like protein (cupin superfamily)